VTQHYVLPSDEEAANRLSLQHLLYETSSQRLILDAGLKPGLSVLEVGCGTGSMTAWFSQAVREAGSVTAIDIHPDYVEQTQEKVRHTQNCKIKVLDVHDIAELGETFDFIYCRMVLHHLKDPESVLRQLITCMKPEGLLVVEEPPCIEQAFLYPHSPTFESFKELILKTYQMNQSRYQIAYTMLSVMQEAGLNIKIQQAFQPLLGKAERKLHLMALRDLSARMMAFGLIDETALDTLVVNLEKALSEAKAVSHYQLIQVAGVKGCTD